MSDSDDGSEGSMEMEDYVEEMTAMEWKLKGNELYKSRDYAESIAAYGEAIKLDEAEPSYRLNRAAAYLMTLDFKSSVADCDSAIAIDPSLAKAYFRKATALKSMGHVDLALKALQGGLVHDPTNREGMAQRDTLRSLTDKMAEAKEANEGGFARRALVIVNTLIGEVGSNVKDLNVLKMGVLLKLQRPEEALNLSNAMMRAGYSGDVGLLMARADCLYSMGDIDNAVKHLQQAMRSDPDNGTARKELKRLKEVQEVKKAGAEAYGAADYDGAIERWSHCLTVSLCHVCQKNDQF